MANNRLWIVDTMTGHRICIGKSFGAGWYAADEIIDGKGLADRIGDYFDETEDAAGYQSLDQTKYILESESFTSVEDDE